MRQAALWGMLILGLTAFVWFANQQVATYEAPSQDVEEPEEVISEPEYPAEWLEEAEAAREAVIQKRKLEAERDELIQKRTQILEEAEREANRLKVEIEEIEKELGLY